MGASSLALPVLGTLTNVVGALSGGERKASYDDQRAARQAEEQRRMEREREERKDRRDAAAQREQQRQERSGALNSLLATGGAGLLGEPDVARQGLKKRLGE